MGVVRDYVVASHVAPVAPPISSCLARFSLAMATTPKRDGNLSFESPNVEIMNILQNICGEIQSLTTATQSFSSKLRLVENRLEVLENATPPRGSHFESGLSGSSRHRTENNGQSSLGARDSANQINSSHSDRVRERFGRFVSPTQAGVNETNPSPRSGEVASGDLQGEFAVIKDSVQRVRLPAELKLNDSKSGIKRQDQATYNIVAKSCRFIETSIKLLSLVDVQEDQQQRIDELYTVAVAHLKYMQEEYASLIVQGKFGTDCAGVYRALQRNSSAFPQEHLETLRAAVTLSGFSEPQRQDRNSTRGWSRGNFRGGFRGGFRGSNRGGFRNFGGNQSFPQARNEASTSDSLS